MRGFRDYRFRDRDFFLIQTEYLRDLVGPLDLILFYDAGKVGSSISNLDEGRLRQTVGVGIVFQPRRLDKLLFRFYLGFGSGEGTRTYIGGEVGPRSDRLVR